jgi:hypothetical protein
MRNAWLTSEDSNSHIPDRKKPFDMSVEFPQISSESGVGDFCSYELRTGGPTRLRHSRSSSNRRADWPLMIADQNVVCTG